MCVRRRNGARAAFDETALRMYIPRKPHYCKSLFVVHNNKTDDNSKLVYGTRTVVHFF